MSENASEQIDTLAKEIAHVREQPLFVMYYHETAGRITDDDVRDIYDEFRRRGWSRDSVHNTLDVLVHSYGGDPHASYRIGQIVHDFADQVTYLVPFHATSGACLVCLGGTKIRLGAYATLGPIDTRIGDVELAAINSFKEFAKDCRRDMEELLDHRHSERTTQVESVLLREMVRQDTAIAIGSLYRFSNLTGYYAHRLMYDYMFKHHSNRMALAQNITSELLRSYPSHDFTLDYHFANLIKLPVEEMDENESDRTKAFVDLLGSMSEAGLICRDIGEDDDGETLKAPFFRFYTRG